MRSPIASEARIPPLGCVLSRDRQHTAVTASLHVGIPHPMQLAYHTQLLSLAPLHHPLPFACVSNSTRACLCIAHCPCPRLSVCSHMTHICGRCPHNSPHLITTYLLARRASIRLGRGHNKPTVCIPSVRTQTNTDRQTQTQTQTQTEEKSLGVSAHVAHTYGIGKNEHHEDAKWSIPNFVVGAGVAASAVAGATHDALVEDGLDQHRIRRSPEGTNRLRRAMSMLMREYARVETILTRKAAIGIRPSKLLCMLNCSPLRRRCSCPP